MEITRRDALIGALLPLLHMAGGQMKILAAIHPPDATRRILECLGLPSRGPPLAPAMFACSRVAGWSAHILEQKQTGRLFRPSARYVGPAPRSLATV